MDVRDLGFSHTSLPHHTSMHRGIFKRRFANYHIASWNSMLKEPPDFIGNIFAKLINNQLATSTLKDKIQNWRMSVVLDTDYYPVSIIFDEITRIEAGFVNDPTLVFKLNFGTILQLVEWKTTMIRGILRGKIKVKGFRHLIALYRFYGFMNSILKG